MQHAGVVKDYLATIRFCAVILHTELYLARAHLSVSKTVLHKCEMRECLQTTIYPQYFLSFYFVYKLIFTYPPHCTYTLHPAQHVARFAYQTSVSHNHWNGPRHPNDIPVVCRSDFLDSCPRRQA